jgi:RNA polymerase sigma-70 factor (ECF subfamily)
VVELPVPNANTTLVNALKQRRPEAAAALFDRHAVHVRRVVARVLGPDPALPDLVQQSLLSALESIDRLEDPECLDAWLTSIAVYTTRAFIRRRSRWRFLRYVAPEDVPEVPSSGVSPEVTEALQATYRVLDQLDPDERIAFSLRFIDGMELTEVAAACGVSLATIKRRLSRAQERFVALARQNDTLRGWLEAGNRWKL